MSWMNEALNKLKEEGRLRTLRECEWGGTLPGKRIRINGQDCIDFSSNDYLGLRNHPEMVLAAKEAIQRYGTSASSSRLISGNSFLHDELERRLCTFKGGRSALVTGSGYALNVAAIPALVNKDDAVILDRLSHASLVDGAKASGAKLFVYAHLDCNALETVLKRAKNYRRKLIVTDTVFSMDGDFAPLEDIVMLAEKYTAEIYADEAHATGIFGPSGKGLAALLQVELKIDYLMGTFSKALGSLGGFIVSPRPEFKSFGINFIRSLIYSTALPASQIAASIKGVELAAKGDALRGKLQAHCKTVTTSLTAADIDFQSSSGPIIPIMVGESSQAIKYSEQLLAKGLFIPAIRFPTVHKKSARLRLSLSAAHSSEDIEKLLHSIKEVFKC